jgi:hypothetical protein
MTELKKVTLEEQLAIDNANAHNSAMANIAGVVNAVKAERVRLEKALAELPAVEATLSEMAKDPIAANEDRRLFDLHSRFGRSPNGRG